MKPANLWHWEAEPIARRTFWLAQSGFSLKLVIDYLVMTTFFTGSGARFLLASLRHGAKRFDWRLATRRVWPDDAPDFAPVSVAGLAMTVKRLRDASHPVWLVCLFFGSFGESGLFCGSCVPCPR